MRVISIPFLIAMNLSLHIFDLQSVEEAECRRAFDSAVDAYRSAFDRSKLPEEVSYAISLFLGNIP